MKYSQKQVRAWKELVIDQYIAALIKVLTEFGFDDEFQTAILKSWQYHIRAIAYELETRDS